MSPADSMTTIYAALAKRAWDSNRARAAELTDLIEQWGRTGVGAAEQRAQAVSIAHSLCGSAGTFGHDEASRAAEELELVLAPPGQDGEEALLSVLMARINAALASEPVLGY